MATRVLVAGAGGFIGSHLIDYLIEKENKKIKIGDPFEIYASRFVNFCTNASNLQKDDFFESSHNLNLMAKILLK